MRYKMFAGTFLGMMGAVMLAQSAQAQQAPRPSIGSSVTVMDITGNSFTNTNFWGSFESLDLDIGVAVTGSVGDFSQLDTLSVGGLGQLGIIQQEGGYSGNSQVRQHFTGRSVASEVNF